MVEQDNDEPRRPERPTEIRSDISELAKEIVEERKRRERPTVATNQEIAAQVIAATRAEHESPAACDYHIATAGIGSSGPQNLISDLGGQVYILANEGFEGTSAERLSRAQALWDRLLPELEAYGLECKARKYTGWSNASGGPVRYAEES